MSTRLSDTQLGQFRARLRDELEILKAKVREELLASDKEGYVDLAGRVHDPGDQSVADLLVDVKLAVIDQHIAAVRDTEAALLRVARGTYGRCVECGGEVGAERLASEPTAARCYGCQERREHGYVQPGRATL